VRLVRSRCSISTDDVGGRLALNAGRPKRSIADVRAASPMPIENPNSAPRSPADDQTPSGNSMSTVDGCRWCEKLSGRVSTMIQAGTKVTRADKARTYATAPDDGLEYLESKLRKHHTLALLGPSGAGKSTLINRMTENRKQRTHAVRSSDHRGCHTTSAGQLLTTRSGALIIDTPGLRELGLWQTAGLDNTYADILELAQSCRFRDCTHTHEPECYVRFVVGQGLLASERFREYLELSRERDTKAKLVKGRKRRYG